MAPAAEVDARPRPRPRVGVFCLCADRILRSLSFIFSILRDTLRRCAVLRRPRRRLARFFIDADGFEAGLDDAEGADATGPTAGVSPEVVVRGRRRFLLLSLGIFEL